MRGKCSTYMHSCACQRHGDQRGEAQDPPAAGGSLGAAAWHPQERISFRRGGKMRKKEPLSSSLVRRLALFCPFCFFLLCLRFWSCCRRRRSVPGAVERHPEGNPQGRVLVRLPRLPLFDPPPLPGNSFPCLFCLLSGTCACTFFFTRLCPCAVGRSLFGALCSLSAFF